MASIYGPEVKFIAGRPFDSEYGHHDPGEVVEQAHEFFLLESLVRAGLLVPYAPDEGYDRLPAHLFNLLNTETEAKAIVEGDPGATKLGLTARPASEAPRVVPQEEEPKPPAKRAAKKAAPKATARKSVADEVTAKSAAKKTASSKE